MKGEGDVRERKEKSNRTKERDVIERKKNKRKQKRRERSNRKMDREVIERKLKT